MGALSAQTRDRVLYLLGSEEGRRYDISEGRENEGEREIVRSDTKYVRLSSAQLGPTTTSCSNIALGSGSQDPSRQSCWMLDGRDHGEFGTCWWWIVGYVTTKDLFF
jgi:hypothetical protein